MVTVKVTTEEKQQTVEENSQQKKEPGSAHLTAFEKLILTTVGLAFIAGVTWFVIAQFSFVAKVALITYKTVLSLVASGIIATTVCLITACFEDLPSDKKDRQLGHQEVKEGSQGTGHGNKDRVYALFALWFISSIIPFVLLFRSLDKNTWFFYKTILYACIPLSAVGLFLGLLTILGRVEEISFINRFFLQPFFKYENKQFNRNERKEFPRDLRHYYLYKTNFYKSRKAHITVLICTIYYLLPASLQLPKPNLILFLSCIAISYGVLISRYYVLLRRIRSNSFCNISSERKDFFQFLINNKNDLITHELPYRIGG